MSMTNYLFEKVSNNNLIYRAARKVVRTHDNDCNADPSKNGEIFLLENLIQKEKLETFFDVGAHKGLITEAIIKFTNKKTQNNKTRIFSFEPNRNNANHIRNKHKDDFLTVINKAVSKQSGSIELYEADLSNDSDYSSHNSVYDMQSIGLGTPTKKVVIPTTSLNEFCTENNIHHIDYLKIDVEGHEAAVLEGASELLQNNAISYMQFEFGQSWMAAKVYLNDVVKLLSQYGYMIFIIKPKKLEHLKYTPFEENRFNMINFLAVPQKIGLKLKNLERNGNIDITSIGNL